MRAGCTGQAWFAMAGRCIHAVHACASHDELGRWARLPTAIAGGGHLWMDGWMEAEVSLSASGVDRGSVSGLLHPVTCN